jgi:hypothetical protein
MPGNNYQKKEITDEFRECKLVECKKMFKPSREDQKFCCHNHGERDWRLKHPRVRILKKSTGTTKGTPAEARRRDTPERWSSYMKANPIYAAMVTRGRSLADCSKGMCWK